MHIEAPAPDEKLLAGDTLLVKGKKEDLLTLEGLQNLEIDSDTPPDLADLESEDVNCTSVPSMA